MHRFALRFSVAFMLLALTMMFCLVFFNMQSILSGNKLVLFAFVNSVILVIVGIFFIIFKERIFLYLENYRREKQI